MLHLAFFNASKFIRETELPAIRNRRATGECLVVPILARPSRLPEGIKDVQATPIKPRQGLTPISKWRDRHEACDTMRVPLLHSQAEKLPRLWA